MSEHSEPTTRDYLESQFPDSLLARDYGPFSSVTIRPGRSDAHARDTAINQEYKLKLSART